MKGQTMTLFQFNTLIKLTRMDPQSIAAKGAELVLVKGLTQTKAAETLGCGLTTINRAVRRLKEVQRLARHIT